MKGSTGYAPGTTFIYRLDPRSKIIGVAALGIVSLRSGVSFLFFASLLSLAVALCARLRAGRLYSAMRPALPFIAIVFLLHACFTKGGSLLPYGLGGVGVTREGLLDGAQLAWRFAILVLAGFLLTATTPPSSLTPGMERLLRPLNVVGVSSQDLALMVSLALRFVPDLQEEMETLRHAQMARGANFAARGIFGRMRALSGLALPLSFAVFCRCDLLVSAMHARAYDGGPRTDLREMSFKRADLLVIALSVLAVAVSLFW